MGLIKFLITLALVGVGLVAFSGLALIIMIVLSLVIVPTAIYLWWTQRRLNKEFGISDDDHHEMNTTNDLGEKDRVFEAEYQEIITPDEEITIKRVSRK